MNSKFKKSVAAFSLISSLYGCVISNTDLVIKQFRKGTIVYKIEDEVISTLRNIEILRGYALSQNEEPEKLTETQQLEVYNFVDRNKDFYITKREAEQAMREASRQSLEDLAYPEF